MSAKMAVALSSVTNGRLIFGLGASWHEPEFRSFAFLSTISCRASRRPFEINVPLVRDGKVEYSGQFYAAVICVLLPPADSRYRF